MEVGEDRHLWLRRLRWRVRGAWAAPAFVLFTLADAVVLQLLPFVGDEPVGPIGSLLIAGFLNLLVVAVLGPLASLGLRRRDARLPAFAAKDRATVGTMALVCLLLLAGGALHRPVVRGEERDLRAQAVAARRYFLRQAPAPFRPGIGEMTTWKAGEDLYRTCIGGPDPERALCVYVETDQSPAGVRLDRSQEPNEVFAGPFADVVRIR